MDSATEKQILEWKEELKVHKERLEQAQAVVQQETKIISMLEGGVQFGEMLLKKNESTNQQSNIMEQDRPVKTASSKK
jgi:methenyltetrahydromethanopterin cyclohydrolase